MPRIVKSLLIFFCLIVIVVGSFLGYLMIGQKTVRSETIEAIDFRFIEDGTYRGHYHQGRWQNTIEVTLIDGEVIDITVIEDMRFADLVLQTVLFERVKQASNLNEVDVISGGTVSSIAYLKALEDALKP